MSEGFEVDPTVLAGLADRLRAAAEELAAGGATYVRADEDARRDFDGLGD